MIGGSGFDILAGYSGVDVILGGDESLALVDGALASTTQEADLSAFYQSDGTPFPSYLTPDSLKTAPANHSISRGQSYLPLTQGDVIHGGPDGDYIDGERVGTVSTVADTTRP